jgi:hypothetical protein
MRLLNAVESTLQVFICTSCFEVMWVDFILQSLKHHTHTRHYQLTPCGMHTRILYMQCVSQWNTTLKEVRDAGGRVRMSVVQDSGQTERIQMKVEFYARDVCDKE